MTPLRTHERRAVAQRERSEIERRIVHARETLAAAREQLHAACHAVTEAEHTLLERRIEREQAALRLARLADALESLERTLDKR
ncbi:MAG: hypothetical protein ACHQ4H_05180 [Ktedonobacterales bacterium]|jgi:hypothetical protein